MPARSKKLSKPICALSLALASLLSFAVPGVAWQVAPPLSLTVVADPPEAANGERLLLTFTVTNTGDDPLEKVRVRVEIPDYTVLEGANVSSEKWAVSTPPRGEEGTVTFMGMSEMAPGESGQLGLWIVVQQQAGQSIILNEYEATAKGLESPVIGNPLAIQVGSLATPEPSPTTPPSMPTVSPSPTVTASPTAIPATPTATPSPTPSPTVTVVIAEIPPTPTPNLSSEQEQLGTLSVSIFVAVTLSIVVLSSVWIVRKRNVRE
jgi:hypothetical protein